MQLAGGMGMQSVKPGDILLYAAAVREKGTLAQYYGCEVVGSVSGGRPFNVYGEPITGVKAIYRRNGAASSPGQSRVLLARHESDQGEKPELILELERLFGPGELVTGFSCQCEAACGILKKRL
jgi:hypothetical protein